MNVIGNFSQMRWGKDHSRDLIRLLRSSLTVFLGVPVILGLGGCANALPIESVLPIAQLSTNGARPLESGRLLPPVPSPSASTSTPINQDYPAASNQKTLVYVEGTSPYLLAQVRQVVPGAFMRSHDGRRVIQTGLFSDQQYAQEQIITLRSRGLTGQITTIQEARQPNLFGQKLLRMGTMLDARYSGKEQLIQPGKTYDLTLTLIKSAFNQAGQVVLPAGSLIRGRVTPIPGGSTFVASSIQVNQSVYPLNARSALLRNDSVLQPVSAGATATDTAIRAAESAIDKSLAQAFRRAGATTNTARSSHTVIKSNAVIPLQLTSDF